MGYQDNFPGVMAIMFDVFGESATYTPAGSGEPFTVLAVFEPVIIDSLETRFLRDARDCLVLESALDDAGVSGPTLLREHATGDTVTEADGTVWNVVDGRYDAGIWMLNLERNIRVVPGG